MKKSKKSKQETIRSIRCEGSSKRAWIHEQRMVLFKHIHFVSCSTDQNIAIELQMTTKIVVDPDRCPHLKKELTTLEHEQLKDGTFSSEYPKLDEDCVMALIYGNNRIIINKILCPYTCCRTSLL